MNVFFFSHSYLSLKYRSRAICNIYMNRYWCIGTIRYFVFGFFLYATFAKLTQILAPRCPIFFARGVRLLGVFFFPLFFFGIFTCMKRMRVADFYTIRFYRTYTLFGLAKILNWCRFYRRKNKILFFSFFTDLRIVGETRIQYGNFQIILFLYVWYFFVD